MKKKRGVSYKMRKGMKAYKRMIKRLSSEQNHRCCYCGKYTDRIFNLADRPTIEHIIPSCMGGTDDYDNLAMACHKCNVYQGWRISVERQQSANLPTLP